MVLQVEDIYERAIEAVRPHMRTGYSLDQLRRDAHPVARFAHGAFEEVAYPQFAPDQLHVDGAALVGEGRIPSDDEQPANATERGYDLLDHAVSKIFLLRVAAHVLEWQYGYGRFIRERQ